MRWPLRNQIVSRLVLLLLVTIVALTLANIQSAISQNRSDYQNRIEEISNMLTESQFPLTANVLENMKSLSGAEFAVVDRQGNTLSKTNDAPPDLQFEGEDSLTQFSLNRFTQYNGHTYYYSAVPVKRVSSTRGRPANVQIFVSQTAYRNAWWRAIFPPLIIAAIVLPLAFLVSLAMANNVTRPLAKLKEQVDQIAVGNLTPIPTPARDDEIRDLNIAVNEMAEKLHDHDEQLRQNEQLNTLIQMGSGIAHNLRNCTTGCSMAIELMNPTDENRSDIENIQVAKRQLKLMNKYIDRFLSISKSRQLSDSNTDSTVELNEVLESVHFLLGPAAKHLNVQLKITGCKDRLLTHLTQDDAEQLMINLINNAISAASSKGVSNPVHSIAPGDQNAPQVSATLHQNEDDRIEFRVSDNGAGPKPELAAEMFHPFVSGSAEGTGLGLSLVDQIVQTAGGEVSWVRENDWTVFCVELNPIKSEMEV